MLYPATWQGYEWGYKGSKLGYKGRKLGYNYSMLRNNASGLEIGLPHQILAGVRPGKPRTALRPAYGRPEGRSRCFPGISPAKIRPGRPIYGPEALLSNIE